MKEGKCAALVLAAVLLSGCGAAEQTATSSAASGSGGELAVVVSVAPAESAAGSTEIMPYQMVKDTRTGYETSNIDAVMDGDLDGFINAYLSQLATGELKK